MSEFTNDASIAFDPITGTPEMQLLWAEESQQQTGSTALNKKQTIPVDSIGTTINLNGGRYVVIELDDSVPTTELAVSNRPDEGQVIVMNCIAVQTANGGLDITCPSTWYGGGGTAFHSHPTISLEGGEKSRFQIIVDGATGPIEILEGAIGIFTGSAP